MNDGLQAVMRHVQARFRDRVVQLGVISACIAIVVLSRVTLDWARDVGSLEPPHVASGRARGGADAGPGSNELDNWLQCVQKRRLFKPAIPLPARSMARESVNKIVGMLSVHGIIDHDGELMAYINVKGLGMRRMKVGDAVEDLFTVTEIQERRVEVEIAGERVELKM